MIAGSGSVIVAVMRQRRRGNMDFNAVAMKLGYPSIFSASPEDAAANLFRLITNQDCGYEEGADQWRSTVRELLDGEQNLIQLNACGAKLTEAQWRETLRLLHSDLDTYLKNNQH